MDEVGIPYHYEVHIYNSEQKELSSKLIMKDDFDWTLDPTTTDSSRPALRLVGGVDISFIKGNDVDACASLVVLSFPELKVYKAYIDIHINLY
jgi:deoxyinosine 3'endonuclease (endonuclease V)